MSAIPTPVVPDNPPPVVPDPEWYRTAVIYEASIRGFFDSNGDGSGDLRGLTDKLDYLQWLGIDCIWLLPFYASPLRDGGYDISDYLAVHPDFGSVEDAQALIEAAHERGIRVIADLVVNHTSDQHAWFQESRSSRDNAKADWYVWADDDSAWSEARIIFIDHEASNWTFDPLRGQYFWHRFYRHQPDLNYNNAEVREAMLEVVDKWLGMGLDGFRLDAVPYLHEAHGTNGENLPATHEYLRSLRTYVDQNFPGKVLLAEANQRPKDVVAYFGAGDECHMCFHFPLMPRLFMALRTHDAGSVHQILAEIPDIPQGCQWGIFLRNHDELTLEMVTDDERAYMYAQYAADPRAKRNVGISRRLFPLVEDDRRQAELLHWLLLTLPGTPVMYYGDEIGMGDNLHLGDRDGVRLPMQWSPDRNGGFSTADHTSVYLPPSLDLVYGFGARNVEAGQRDPGSFLNWVRALLHLRREHRVFGVGALELVVGSNSAVLAYVRVPDAPGEHPVLCVANFSDAAQHVELSLPAYEGMCVTELVGGAPFPEVAGAPYPLSLPGYGFLAFDLLPAADA